MAKKQALVLTVAFLATIFAVVICDTYQGIYADCLAEEKPSFHSLMTGQFARRIDLHLETKAWSMRKIRPLWNETMLGLFRETPAYVVAGRDRWLFTESSLVALDPLVVKRSSAEIIEGYHRIRKFCQPSVPTLGLVVVIPEKWRLNEERSPRGKLGSYRRSLYHDTIETLTANGIATVDVLAAMKAERHRNPRSQILSSE